MTVYPHPIKQLLGRISARDVLTGALIAAFIFFLTAFLGNLRLFGEFFRNAQAFPFLYSLQLFFLLLWGVFLTPWSAVLTTASSLLFSFNVLLLWKSARWQNLLHQKVGFAGLASAVLGIGCLACSAVLPVAAVSLLGAGFMATLLPYSSIFFQALALFLLSLSTFLSLRVMTQRRLLSPQSLSGRTKQILIAGTSTALILLFGFLFRNEIGNFFWTRFHAPGLAAWLAPRDPGLHFAMGNYYFEGKKYNLTLAKQKFLRVIELDERFPGAHYQLSRVYFIENHLPDALNEINKELAYTPDVKRSYYIRGLVYGYMGMLDNAAQDFETFLRWKPESWAGHNDLAWIYFRMGEYEKALAVSETGLRFNPDNVWLLNSQGVSLMNLGRKTEAKEAFENALAQAEKMGPLAWGRAYPGNNPALYGEGIRAMQQSIQKNLELLE